MSVALALIAAASIGAAGPRSGMGAAVPRGGAGPDTSFLTSYAATYRFTLGRPASIALTRDGDAVLFLRAGPRRFEQDLWSFDPATGRERLLATASQLTGGGAEQLTAEERARRERMRSAARGVASFKISEDGKQVLIPISGRLFVLDRATGARTELPSANGTPVDARFSPDGRMVACARNGDLFVTDVATKAEKRLTKRENDDVTNGLAEFVAQEEMDRFEGYWWSPDSRWIAYEHADTRGLERFHIADAAHPENAPTSWPYPRPGKKNAEVTLGVIAATGGPTVWVRWDRARYPYLNLVRWSKNAPLTLMVMNRDQTEAALLAADPATGATRTLLIERDAAWIDLDSTMPRWLDDGSGFLWSSEKSGTRLLELHGPDGAPVRTLTTADLGYDKLLAVDQEARVAYVAGSSEPTEMHLWRVPLETSQGAPTRLSRNQGMHGAFFSEKHGVRVHTIEPLTGPRRWIVERGDGTSPGELKSVAEQPPFAPKLELTRVGPLEFRAMLVRPRDFRPGRRYPVLLHVYGGPTSLTVRAVGDSYLLDQWYADHGFIVVSLDVRGTPGRGRAWERVVKNDFIGTPLEDQAGAIRALGAKYPELDLDRVGIFGWSFGGYFSAMAVMRHPELFKAGVAGAPVVDWRDYDTFYTERYIGTPERDPRGYETSSVLTYARRLSRPLLIIHGTSDDNVYFLHSLKLCDALTRAGKSYEFVPLVGNTHMVSDPGATIGEYKRIASFFERELRSPGASAGPRAEAGSR